MANVETEQNAPVAPLEGSNSSSASVAVCEENLAALLKAVTGPEESPPVSVPEVMQEAPAALVAEASARAADLTSSPEAHLDSEPPVVPPASELLPEAEPQKGEVPRNAENPPDPAQREVAPVVESQQEVVSKLALLSSIKQRRAVAVRPEPEVAPAAVRGDATSGKDLHTPIDQNQRAVAMVQPMVAETQSVHQPQAKQVAAREPAHPAADDPKKATPSVNELLPKAADIPRGNRGTGPAPRQVVHSARPGSALFPVADQVLSDKPRNFVTSGAGMTLIGGTILAGGLTAFLLMGHGAKPATSSKPAMTDSVRASNPTPESTAANKQAEKSTAEKPLTSTPALTSPGQDLKKEVTSKVDQAQTGRTGSAGPPANSQANSPVNPQVNPPVNPAPTQPPAAVNAQRTLARTFAPPVAGSPADTTIVDAPPALSTANPVLPAVGGLPTRVAPLPPPPTSAQKPSSLPRQVGVAGKVQATRLVRKVTPVYPSLAKATRVQGVVRFRATIAIDGQIKTLILLAGPPPLVQGATDAVRQWRYQPTIVNGDAVEVVTEIEVAFTL